MLHCDSNGCRSTRPFVGRILRRAQGAVSKSRTGSIRKSRGSSKARGHAGKPRQFNQWRKRFYASWKESFSKDGRTAVVIALVTLLLSSAVALMDRWATWSWDALQGLPCEIQLRQCQLTQPEGLRIARNNPALGSAVQTVIPFTQHGEQYIAVAVRDQMQGPAFSFRVHLLRREANAYLDQSTKLSIFTSFPGMSGTKLGRDFGVIDIEGNGDKDVFAVRESIGMAMQTWWLTVWNISSNVYYHATATANLNNGVPDLTMNPNVPEAVQTWVAEKVDSLAGVQQAALPVNALQSAAAQWVDDNGSGAVDRLSVSGDKVKLRLRWRTGNPTRGTFVSSWHMLTAGRWRWVFFFKGPVALLDARRERFKVVILSQAGDWYGARSAVLGRRFLWIQDEVQPRVLAFNPANSELESIYYHRSPSASPFDVLHVRSGKLFVGATRVPIPRDLNVAGEFIGTRATGDIF